MDTLEIFKCLADIPSPSGFEKDIKEKLKEFIAPYVDKFIEDIHGNLFCYKINSDVDNVPTIMLIAHMDEIGLMVTYIDENGSIYFSSLGGVDLNLLRGRKVCIIHEGERIHGVIGVRPIHMKSQANNREIELSDMWIDIGYRDKKKIETLISIGDPVVIDSHFETINNRIIISRGCDNKSGLTAMVKTMEMLATENLEYNIVAVASVQEELGLRGAKTSGYTIQPDICIAIDVCHATDYPTIDKARYGDIKLDEGPVIPIGSDLTSGIQLKLREMATNNSIPSQVLALPGISGTDINAIQVNKGGCATGLLSIPCRYMHSSVEMVSIQDINYCSDILYNVCKTYNSIFLSSQFI